MKAVIVANTKAQHQWSWGGAFQQGLARHGIQAVMRQEAEQADLIVLWGVRRKDVIKRQRERGGEICILERGYLGDRFHWTSVSFGGGLNGNAGFRGVSDDPARLNQHFPGILQPWRKQEGYALLIGQVPGDMSIAGKNISRWYHEAAADLKEAGYNVHFRSHPLADQNGFRPEKIDGVTQICGTLDETLAGAALVATFNSNTAVISVAGGIPTIAADKGSMAFEVTGRHAKDIVTPDREPWAARLAWKQWSLEEIASGECWARVGQAYAGAA